MPIMQPYKRWQNAELDPSTGVSIKGCGFNLSTAADAQALVEMINNQRPLVYLELEGNTLGVDAAKEIGKALEGKSEIEAALWKDLFTGRLKTEIPKALSFLLGGIDLSNARLQCLDLSDNAIGLVGMAGLQPFFQCRSSFSLKELYFNNNGWGPEASTMLAHALLDCYRKSLDEGGEVFQLRVFQSGRSRIESKGAIALASFFKEIKSLEEVHMPQNGIYTEGINALADAFCENPNLKVLNLNDNTISAEGCIKLSQCIRQLVHLKELNIGDCLILTEGVHHLSRPLSECSNLEKIVLESNEIDDEGGLEIANILAKLPKLNEVNLCSNELSSRAVEDIRKILKRTVPNIQIDSGEDEENGGAEEEEDVEKALETSRNGDETRSKDVDDNAFKEEKEFLKNPSQVALDKLLPDPVSRLRIYFKNVAVESNIEKTYAELCIDSAFTLCNLGAPSTDQYFFKLLGEVVQDRFFSTHVLNRLGLCKSEEVVEKKTGFGGDSASKRSIETIPTNTINHLIDFIKKTELSNTILATLHFFVNGYKANVGTTSTQIKKLLETLDTKLYD